MNEVLIQAARGGVRLPRGVYPFVPPLVLRGAIDLHGSGEQTILQAPVSDYVGPLVVLENRSADLHDHETGLPRRQVIRRLRIKGPGEAHHSATYGILLDAAMVTAEHVDVVGCHFGVTAKFSVDVLFSRCLFSRNVCNIYLPGSTSEWSTTSTRFEFCNIRQALSYGALIQGGQGIQLRGGIIESNGGRGLSVMPRAGVVDFVDDFLADGVWFEGNKGGHLEDPSGRGSYPRCTFV